MRTDSIKTGSTKKAKRAIPDSSEHSLEVTGLGLIAALAIAFWGLVSDGTLPLSQYLVFVVFLTVSAAGLVWRIFKLAPAHAAKSAASRQPRI